MPRTTSWPGQYGPGTVMAGGASAPVRKGWIPPQSSSTKPPWECGFGDGSVVVVVRGRVVVVGGTVVVVGGTVVVVGGTVVVVGGTVVVVGGTVVVVGGRVVVVGGTVVVVVVGATVVVVVGATVVVVVGGEAGCASGCQSGNPSSAASTTKPRTPDPSAFMISISNGPSLDVDRWNTILLPSGEKRGQAL